ncbi:glutamate receptor 2.2-like isoform X1 [Malus sylvestris]|uniref:glutamate receptor 2.2-like isoform X1 n=1 Tax=Malus sylvestris TaxID=3752 RepID=UPI0021AD1075|nr:glutamate receptor 2.2-like isoform X1 [Malus sylvestris]
MKFRKPTNLIICTFFFLVSLRMNISFAMMVKSQNTTIPVNVGVVFVHVADAAIATGFWTPRCGLAKGLNSTSKSNNDFVGQVFLGDYDALAAAPTIRANSSLYVDFTMPYTESGVAMVVRTKDYTSKNAWVFLKPLSWDLWSICLCFFIWTGLAVSVLEHRINEEFRGPPSDQVGTIRFSGPILIAGVASSLALIISAASFFYRYGYVLMTRVALVWRRIRDMFGKKNSGLDAVESLPAAPASQTPQAIQITQI